MPHRDQSVRPGTNDESSRGRLWPFFAVALPMPALGSALGIDGGAIFQIVAVENLGLDPTTIGLAFALGVLSVPVQILAARLPLWRARRNLQLFLVVASLGCAVLALLVGLDVVGAGLALIALGVTVVAEISLSVLYAPSWQPLLNYGLASKERQLVNARGRAGGGLIVAGAILLFGSTGPEVRTAMLAAAAAVALVLLAATVALAVVRAPVERPAQQVATAMALAVAAAANLTILLALLERAYQDVDEARHVGAGSDIAGSRGIDVLTGRSARREHSRVGQHGSDGLAT